MKSRGTQRSAFTLIELLVVVAIIALLISILLPSLGAARESARAVVCGQNMRGFGNGLNQYAMENKDGIPGLNTSGIALEALKYSWGADVGVIYRSKMPVQNYDWMTPILSPGMELPAERAERFKFLLDKYRCASQQETALRYDSPSAMPDLARFVEKGAFPAPSYMAAAFFQFFGQNMAGRVVAKAPVGSAEVPIYAKVPNPNWEVLVENYLPRIDRVGSSARKIFVADGTRYVDEAGALDYDPSPVAGWFGSFSSGGGWWTGDTAYGVKVGSKTWGTVTVTRGSPGKGLNLTTTYRHGSRGSSGDCHDNKGTINAVFFDGHVERMTDRQSRELGLWYPKGGIVQNPAEGMTDVQADFVIP